MASVVGNRAGMHKTLPQQTSAVVENVAIVCATLRRERFTWSERGYGNDAMQTSTGTAPCPGFRSNIAHNVQGDVDDGCSVSP
jgi:hypothetical protein